MGAWGYQPFENDDALDWVANLRSTSDLSLLESTLSDVIETKVFLDARECSKAIAAAEVIAALHGNFSSSLPDQVREWLKGKPTPDRRLNPKARQAIDLILTASELQELWQENTADYPKWIESIEQIRSHLPNQAV